MSRTSLSDISGLADPFMLYNFDLVLASAPGGGSNRGLTIQCMTTALPGWQIEQVTSALHGVEVTHAGRQVYSKTFQATFLETRTMEVRSRLLAWMMVARNNAANSGSFKSTYAVPATILLYDDIPNVIRTIQVFGVFPTSVDDLSLDGSSSTAANTSVTFSYDYTEES